MKKSSSSGGFKYRPRSEEDVAARQTIAGNREGFLIEGVKTFSNKPGDHTVRIMPPTWPKARHYGLDVYVHYGIGPDEGSYLCLAKMKDEECPICEERKRAISDGEEELADALKWTRRVLCWIIDRDNEREGPVLWSMPQSFDLDLSKRLVDRKTREVFNIDDPDTGYDVLFSREGQRRNTKYSGIELDRRPSPLSDSSRKADDWLDVVQDKPIPDLLVFQDAEYLEDLVSGGLASPSAARKKRGEEDEDRPRKRKGRDEEEEERPRKRKGRDEEEEEEERPRKRKGRDEEEEEEEERPRRRARVRDEEEEEEDDRPRRSSRRARGEEEEEEEEERPRRGRSRSSSDEEEEENEDEPRSRRKTRSRDEEDEDDRPSKVRSRLSKMQKRHSKDDEDDD